MKYIAPSILSADFTKLGKEIQAVEAAGADWIHVDVMDGRFVPNLTMGPFIVAHCRRATDLPLDVHLMVERPESLLESFAKAGASHLTVHVETCPHLHRSVQLIRDEGARAGVALNPAPPVSTLEHVLADLLDGVVHLRDGGRRLLGDLLHGVGALGDPPDLGTHLVHRGGRGLHGLL